MRNKSRKIALALVSALEKSNETEAKKKANKFKQIAYKWGATKQTGEILREFGKAWKRKDGEIATVVSATPLSEGTKSKIKKKLKNKKYLIEEEVDPSIIGGVALYLGNEYLIDATLKGKLKRLLNIAHKI